MLNYIKSQIKAQHKVEEKPKTVEEKPEDISNDVILEYAKLFQELDELTENGTEEGKTRKLGVDIPFDDDTEVDNVEFDIGNSKIADIPGDATVPDNTEIEDVTESYVTMKTLDMFVQEVANNTPRLSRESDSMYNNRIMKIANKLYEEYCVDAEETGQFGFNKISVGDNRVPTKVNIDFGPIDHDDNRSFMSKVNVIFATDEDHKITKKQFDSLAFVRNGAFTGIGEPLMKYMESNYVIPEKSSLWDVVTPTGLYIPKGNGDSFCVVLEYVNEITNKKEYFGWTRSVRNDDKTNINSCETINMESFVQESSWEDRDSYLVNAETAARRQRMKRKPNRFFQEAIDFGDGGGGDDPAPSVDTGGGDTSTDDTSGGGDDLPPADDSSGTDTGTDASGDDDKETAAVNNVSADIAKEVADNTKEDAENSDNVTFDDDDVSESEESKELDSDLADLDASGADDDELDTEAGFDGDVDFENMTINDMLEQGSEKLKGMTLNEIKEFINSDDKEAVQEAFFLTSKNINKEVDVCIRKCLGILNDANMNVDKIFKTFKVDGHKLNRVLSKAIKSPRVYSSDEIDSLKSLNKALSDLLSSLKITNKSSYVASVKQKITKFIDECKVVSIFVEDKLMGKAVQEAFIQEGLFLTASNAKKDLVKKVKPVIADINSIVKKSDQGKLTRGTLLKMYKGKTSKMTYGTTYKQSGGVILSDYEYNINTAGMRNIDSLAHLIEKILKRTKVQKAFNNRELKNLEKLNDMLNDYVDFIETIIADNASDSVMKKFTEDSKKLLNLLEEFGDDKFVTSDNNTLTEKVNKGDDKNA